MTVGSGCFQVHRLNTVGEFCLLRLTGRAEFWAALRTPAELSLGIFSTLHNRCWSSENSPGLANASLLETNRCFLLVGRRLVLCFCLSRRPAVVLPTLCSLLCLLGVSPPAIRYFPLAHTLLFGWLNVLFQSFTPTCDEHNASLIGAFCPLFWRCTCVHADSRTTLGCLLNCIWTLRERLCRKEALFPWSSLKFSL